MHLFKVYRCICACDLVTFEHHFLKCRNIPKPLLQRVTAGYSRSWCKFRHGGAISLSFHCHAFVKSPCETSQCPDKSAQILPVLLPEALLCKLCVWGKRRGQEGCLIPCPTLGWWNQLVDKGPQGSAERMEVFGCCCITWPSLFVVRNTLLR